MSQSNGQPWHQHHLPKVAIDDDDPAASAPIAELVEAFEFHHGRLIAAGGVMTRVEMDFARAQGRLARALPAGAGIPHLGRFWYSPDGEFVRSVPMVGLMAADVGRGIAPEADPEPVPAVVVAEAVTDDGCGSDPRDLTYHGGPDA